MNGTEQVQPSSKYYLLALLFFAVGIALTIYFLTVDVRRIRESMVRMDLPGQMDLELRQHVNYAIFAEYPGLQTAPHVPVEQAHGLLVNCQVHTLTQGNTVTTKDTTGKFTYTYGNRKGISVMEFEVPHDGSGTVECQGPAEISGQKVQVAVGGGVSNALTAVTGRSFLVLTGGIVIGTLIFVRVAMLRLQSRRNIQEQGLKPV
jgi:hypothetical protein